jgi:hypothetical protein
MPLDLLDICNDDFDGLLRDISGSAQTDDVSEERLVELISSTLRQDSPEARARGFVDLANLCYAMADKALGSNAAPAKCLKIIVSADKRH